MKLSVTTKIFLGFSLLIAIYGALSGYNIVKMKSLRQNTTFVRNGLLPVTLEVATLMRSVKSLESQLQQPPERVKLFVRSYLHGASPYLALRHAVARLQRRAKHSDLSHAHRKRLAALIGQLESQLVKEGPFQRNIDRFVSRAGSGVAAKALEEIRADLRVFRLWLQKTQRQIQRAMRQFNSSAEREESQSFLAMMLLSALGILFGVVILIVSQMSLRPLRILRESVQRISRGEFAHRVTIATRDEIGELALDFNSMAESLAARDRELAERQARLVQSERLAAIGKMMSQITHEIRNPLSSIGLNTELLEEELSGRVGDKSEAMALLRAIASEVDRLAEVTEQYLRLGRPPKPDRHDVQLTELLDGLLFFLREEINQRGVNLQRRFQTVPSIQIDENQFKQALMNIIRNALDAMNGGGELEITLANTPTQLLIRIRDSGVGIPPEAMAYIFDPFYSTKESGTGLGLPLTQQIVQEHGGSIAVESTPGQGTCFDIRLPLA